MQREKHLQETELVLALMVQGGVATDSPGHVWVIPNERAAEFPKTSILGQPGYVLPPSEVPADDFSDTAGLELLAEVPSVEYMGRCGIGVSDVLDVPDLLDPLMRAIDASALEDREKFYRAAYWFSRSAEVWSISRSLSYISIINAIEVLSPERDTDLCPTCGLNRAPGTTAKFRETVERYAGDFPERDELYRLRSGLVHGHKILIADGLYGGWHGFTPLAAEERWRHEVATAIARVVILGWMFDRVPSQT